MTRTVDAQMQTRRIGRPKDEIVTIEEDWGFYALDALAFARALRFPSQRYANDPVGFFRDVLGVAPWSKQVEVLEALRDHDRVAVKSGRRVSKSNTAAGSALWWFTSWTESRVVMTSTTARQVDTILWRELSMMKAFGGRCLACKTERATLIASGLPEAIADFRVPRPCPHSALIDGDIGLLARTGLRSGFREVWGFSARDGTAAQGIAGKRMLFIVDEASGVPQAIFDAIEGNRAGGAKVLLLGNPTKNEGEFFDAFHSKNKANRTGEDADIGYHCITISSEDSPNVVAGEVVVEGLATREYIREREIEWGRESPMFIVHVDGNFALHTEGRIFSLELIGQAQERWHELTERDRDELPEIAMRRLGRLFIGLDPAGESGTGDESAFSLRRGSKHLATIVRRGLNDEQHLVHLLSLVEEWGLPRERPVVVLDREGSIGASLAAKIRAHLEMNEANPPFELETVRASDRALRSSHIYDRQRDALTANLLDWLRDGGAMLEDVKLAGELNVMEWRQLVNGRFKVTPKDVIKKLIGRSPDRYDSLALACWVPSALREDRGELSAPSASQPEASAPPVSRRGRVDLDEDEDEDDRIPTIDPYGHMDRGRR